MSLMLVRHGQARAGTDDYDRLSDLGREQCRRLGAWLAATGHRFDAVVIGNMRRHRQSYEQVCLAYAEADMELVEARVDHGLDEFDHKAVFEGFARDHVGHPSLAAMANGGLINFGTMIHAALSAWCDGAIDDLPESWSAFGTRVANAATRLDTPGGKVLALTSGGVISRLAQTALGAPDRSAIDLNLTLRNSGLCELHPRPYGHALGTWNAVPHLHDVREMWTYY